MPSDIHFNASYNGSFYHADGKISEQKGSVKISGSIIKREEPYPFDYFVAFCDRENTSLIAGIEFNRTPDWDLNDYPESVRQLWDDVRKIVNNYFNTNYPSAGN